MDSESGLGILSTFPIEDVTVHSLPANIYDEDRKVQQAVTAISSTEKMLISNTHLTHLNDSSLRKSQCDALIEIVSLNHSCSYHFLCVDFNAEKGSEEVIKFIAETKSTDCYTAGKGDQPCYSLADTFIKGKKVCIDYIFSIPAKTSPTFVDSEIVLNKRDQSSGLFPSDHFGIKTTIIID